MNKQEGTPNNSDHFQYGYVERNGQIYPTKWKEPQLQSHNGCLVVNPQVSYKQNEPNPGQNFHTEAGAWNASFLSDSYVLLHKIMPGI